LKKEKLIQVQETSRTPERYNQNRNSLWLIIVRILSTENKERILKPVREKSQIIYNGKAITVTADFSIDSLKTERMWN
jgi:hypothetical protein